MPIYLLSFMTRYFTVQNIQNIQKNIKDLFLQFFTRTASSFQESSEQQNTAVTPNRDTDYEDTFEDAHNIQEYLQDLSSVTEQFLESKGLFPQILHYVEGHIQKRSWFFSSRRRPSDTLPDDFKNAITELGNINVKYTQYKKEETEKQLQGIS